MAKQQNFAHPPRGHVAILAYDVVNNRWQVLECTADGYLKTRLQEVEGTVPIQQTTPALLQPGMNTYDGAAWRKQPLIWGYSDRYLVQQQNVSNVAGDYTSDLPSVPAGEVWRVAGVSVYRGTNVNQYARVQVYDGSTAVSIEDIDVGTLGRFFSNSVEIILKAGDNVRVVYTGATVDEVVITVALGYKMSVDM